MSDSNSPITSEIPAAERDLWLRKAQTLSDALPYMCQFGGKRVVVKYGGHAMGEEALALQFAQDIVLLNQVGIEPVVVHGGGPQIKKMLERLKIQSEFIDGLRVTDKATVDIVEMVLAGSINAEIVTAINRSGGFAIGLSGKDGNLIKCRKLARTKKDPDSSIETVLDLGFVGEPVEVNTHILKHFEQSDIIPVVAPIGYGEQGETFNINADTAAGSIAGALQAARLLMLTDVPGVLDKNKKLIPDLTITDARRLMEDGTISGGMIPKIETCIDAVESGVEAAVIMDGRMPHAVLLELFTPRGAGTLIHKG
ncbi:acetylglutamate kinase [Novispirillum itersonii]|uniref:acetylglutamate kinase n=1 Tax=Novispirillum itersonii TaxID=189 RepID=UPI000363A3D0|nr:acetylglutamate kinase [Novispirillum itersonii]